MKNADMNQVLVKAMEDFKDAYDRLRITIDRYERTGDTDINNLRGFTESYPFDKSFDELEIDKWVTTVTEHLQQPKFTVLDYEYLNTGGNCMVGIHTVWLPDKNQTVYVLTNEEGCTMATVDYVRHEILVDDYDELFIETVDWGRVTGFEKYFELYRRCLNDYTRDDCKHFGYTRGLPYHLLSDELREQVTEDYVEWCAAENGCLIDTDGERVIVSPSYEYDTALNNTMGVLLQKIKDFKRWHDTTAGVEDLYNEDYILKFAGREVSLPYNADVWDAVDDLLNRTIEEW